jgi:predicted glycoside hydrolase/deacetylase ChbG (UPF0249 family)
LAESLRNGEPQEVRVIVNADDLGMSPEVNDAIFDLMARGRITSSSVLANGPAFLKAVRTLPKFPHCSFGVHLNIVEYEPLTRNPNLNGLLDREGRMRPIPAGFHFSLPLLRAVYEEFSEQIRKLLSHDVPISHIDSHTHVHLHPRMFPVVKSLQWKYGIRCVRTQGNFSDRPWPFRRRVKNSLYNWALRYTCNSRTTDARADLEHFVRVGREMPAFPPNIRTVETLTHPANPYYLGDVALALSPWEKELPFPIRLISFHQIAR